MDRLLAGSLLEAEGGRLALGPQQRVLVQVARQEVLVGVLSAGGAVGRGRVAS